MATTPATPFPSPNLAIGFALAGIALPAIFIGVYLGLPQISTGADSSDPLLQLPGGMIVGSMLAIVLIWLWNRSGSPLLVGFGVLVSGGVGVAAGYMVFVSFMVAGLSGLGLNGAGLLVGMLGFLFFPIEAGLSLIVVVLWIRIGVAIVKR